MSDSISIKFDTSEVFSALDRIVMESDKNTRPAAQAGAQILYNEVKLNVSSIGKVTGNLERSIYQVFSKDNSTEKKSTYHVSWNSKKAPHGGLVEYGHIQTRKVYLGSDGKWYTSKALLDQPKQVGARPFVRPAYDAKSSVALQASKDKWNELMATVIGELK